MKRIVIFALLFFAFFLSSCEKKQVIEEISCTNNQIEVDGECINLTGQEIQLRTIIENTSLITNYQLNVTITEGETEFDIIMMFDNNKSSITTLNQTDYYIDNLGVCEHTTVINNLIFSNSYDCFNNDTYLFFKDFDYSWFTIIDGKYNLNQENYEIIETFLKEAFPNSTIESFRISSTDSYISEMTAELLIDDQTYIIKMNISLIDNIVIEIPEEVSN